MVEIPVKIKKAEKSTSTLRLAFQGKAAPVGKQTRYIKCLPPIIFTVIFMDSTECLCTVFLLLVAVTRLVEIMSARTEMERDHLIDT